MKTLRKFDIETMEKELKVLVNPERYLGGKKGDYDDPYTQAEFDSMFDSGTWNGGYVDGYYMGPGVCIFGSTGNVSGSYYDSPSDFLLSLRSSLLEALRDGWQPEAGSVVDTYDLNHALSGIAFVIGNQYSGAIYVETDTYTLTPGLRIYSANTGTLLVTIDSSWYGNVQ